MKKRRNSGWLCNIFLTGQLFILMVCTVLIHQGQAVAGGKEPIRIATVFAETGLAAGDTLSLNEMINLAVEVVNGSGGVLGRPLEIIRLDNRSTPVGAKKAAIEAVEQDVVAVIGAHWSSHSLAMAPILQDAGVPMISPTSTNPDVTRNRNYVFRSCFVDFQQGKTAGRFAAVDLRGKTAAVITNIDEKYSTALASYFSKTYLQFDGKIVYEGEYRGTATDFSPLIDELVRLQPDVVYLPGYARSVGLFIKQARILGLESIFLGSDGWENANLIAGEAIRGSYTTVHWHSKAHCSGECFVKKMYLEKYGREIDSTASPLAYDALMLLADAIRRAGTTDHVMIRDALAATQGFQGETGEITMDSNGDPTEKSILIVRYENNGWSVVKPVGSG